MAEVQWIRLIVGMFDGNSFKRIKRAKIGGVSYRDKLTAVWFELLDLAGKSNANGYLIDNNEIPYRSFEDIATMLDRDEKEIELCMQYFINERMVEIVEDVYCLANFMKYQNQDGLEKIREQNRIRQANYKQRKKLLKGNVTANVTANVTVTDGNAIEEEKEEEGEKEEEYQSFIHMAAEADYIERKIEESDLEGSDAEVYKSELKESLKQRFFNGTLGKGVVFMSDEQFQDLIDKLGGQAVDKYFGIVAEEELKGHHYKKKTHYQAMLDMAMKDRKIEQKG